MCLRVDTVKIWWLLQRDFCSAPTSNFSSVLNFSKNFLFWRMWYLFTFCCSSLLQGHSTTQVHVRYVRKRYLSLSLFMYSLIFPIGGWISAVDQKNIISSSRILNTTLLQKLLYHATCCFYMLFFISVLCSSEIIASYIIKTKKTMCLFLLNNVFMARLTSPNRDSTNSGSVNANNFRPGTSCLSSSLLIKCHSEDWERVV